MATIVPYWLLFFFLFYKQKWAEVLKLHVLIGVRMAMQVGAIASS